MPLPAPQSPQLPSLREASRKTTPRRMISGKKQSRPHSATPTRQARSLRGASEAIYEFGAICSAIGHRDRRDIRGSGWNLFGDKASSSDRSLRNSGCSRATAPDRMPDAAADPHDPRPMRDQKYQRSHRISGNGCIDRPRSSAVLQAGDEEKPAGVNRRRTLRKLRPERNRPPQVLRIWNIEEPNTQSSKASGIWGNDPLSSAARS